MAGCDTRNGSTASLSAQKAGAASARSKNIRDCVSSSDGRPSRSKKGDVNHASTTAATPHAPKNTKVFNVHGEKTKPSARTVASR
jgi:hypothetical protein